MSFIYDFHFLRLITDVLLMLSLIYLAARLGRGGGQLTARPRQLLELESGLRALIKDAESAGSALNDQLMGRQSTLERLLGDLSSAEQRIGRAVASAEGIRTSLDSAASRTYIPPQATHSSLMAARLRPSEPIGPDPRMEAPRMEAPRFEEAVREQVIEEPAPKWGSRNIYGQFIESAPPRASTAPARQQAAAPPPAQGYRSLSDTVERDVSRYEEPSRTKGSMQRIYEAAERMLRAGQDLESVAAQTRLPIDEVRVLSQVIIQNSAAPDSLEQSERGDPRLGVLGGLRRQTHTV